MTSAGMELIRSAAPRHVARVRELLVDTVTPADLAALARIGKTVMERIDPDGSCPSSLPVSDGCG